MTNNLHGIVLKRIDLKNDDKLITIYTKEIGKISVIAKGVKKLNSKRKSSVEIFNIIRLNIKEYHNINYLQDTVIFKSFIISDKSPKELINCMYILEITDKLIPLDEPNQSIFKLLTKTIYLLSNAYNDNIISAYNLKLLKILGFLDSSKYRYLKSEVKDHLSTLEKQTYEEILKIKAATTLQNFIRMYLSEATENVIESKIRTLYVSSKLNQLI